MLDWNWESKQCSRDRENAWKKDYFCKAFKCGMCVTHWPVLRNRCSTSESTVWNYGRNIWSTFKEDKICAHKSTDCCVSWKGPVQKQMGGWCWQSPALSHRICFQHHRSLSTRWPPVCAVHHRLSHNTLTPTSCSYNASCCREWLDPLQQKGLRLGQALWEIGWVSFARSSHDTRTSEKLQSTWAQNPLLPLSLKGHLKGCAVILHTHCPVGHIPVLIMAADGSSGGGGNRRGRLRNRGKICQRGSKQSSYQWVAERSLRWCPVIVLKQ